MKKITILAIAVISFAACNHKPENAEQQIEEITTSEAASNDDAAPQAEAVYTCPMHPEVTGNKGDKCPKCEMDLVVKE